MSAPDNLPALLAACRSNPAPLSPWEADFLRDMERRHRPPSERQAAILARIAIRQPGGGVDFASVNRAALARLPDVLARLLPGGKRVGLEWHAGSLRGEPGDSCRVNLRTGRWADFATGDKGGDPVSLAAAVASVPQAEAARRLGRMLGMECGQ